MEILPIQIDLVENETRVSTLVIAENTNIKYESIRDLVNKYKEELLQFGNIPTTDFKSALGKEAKKLALLNEQQSTLLITFLKNTKEVVSFKINLVKAFFMMKERLQNQLQPQEQNILPVLVEMAKVNQMLVQSNQEIVANLTNMNQGLHEMLATMHNIKHDTSRIKENIKILQDTNKIDTNFILDRIRASSAGLNVSMIDVVRKEIDLRATELSDGTKTNIQSITRAIYSYINNEFNVSSYYHIPQAEALNAIALIKSINIGVQNA